MSAKVKPGYKQTEVGVIPEDWEVKNMLNLCTLQRGFDITEATRVAGTIPVFSSSGLSYYHNKAMAFPPGVVTGRKGILGKVFLINEPFWPHDTTLWVKDFKGNLPAYVALVLQNFHLERLDAATSVPTLNRNNLAGYSVAFPPTKAEQEAIAEALSDADALIESLEQLLAKKRHVKQGAMQELLTGKKRLPGFTGEWVVKRLDNIATFFSGGTPSTAVADYYSGDIPWITSGDLNQTYIRDVRGRISESGFEHSAAQMIEAHTLLIALYGATAGVTAISEIPAAINQAVLAIIPNCDARRFLYFKLSHLKNWLITTYTQGGQPNLSGEIIKSLEMLMPSLPEQTAIAAVLSDMDAEIAALESKLAKARQLKLGMMQELLTGRIRLV